MNTWSRTMGGLSSSENWRIEEKDGSEQMHLEMQGKGSAVIHALGCLGAVRK